MSNTRKTKSGKPFRQERFASSVAFERGLMGNLVARRCAILDRAEDRALIWFIQYLSHQPGGLKSVATSLYEKYGHRIGTSSMRKFGCRPGQVYDSEKVRRVRSELARENNCFPLRGEIEECFFDQIIDDSPSRLKELKEEANNHPDKYPASAFEAICREELREERLEELLNELCLNPAVPLLGDWPWWFAEFIICLREFQKNWIEQSACGVETEIGSKVAETIAYAMETRCLVLIEGNPRIGKTFAARAFCEKRPGKTRYVQVPCTNDEIGFYRAIAKAIGVSINLNSKAQELRQRIEETLQAGDLAIVFDEAHYLWPNLIDPRTLPARINWIMTALVNYSVPVALVATPQFLKTQKVVEERTRWTSEQFTGRLGHYEPLPQTVSEHDLEKVARALLPHGDDTSIEILIRYAQASAKYLAGIEAVTRRAQYLAARDSRSQASRADVKRAINESVIPSDSALAAAMQPPARKSRQRQSVADLNASEPNLKKPLRTHSRTDLLDESSNETPGNNRLEAHRKSGALVPG